MITTIALDLEGVLISSAVSVFPRPGLAAFMDQCAALVPRVVLFSAVAPARSRRILQLLADEGSMPAWSAEMEIIDWSGPVKDLRFVCTVPENALLVDDNPQYVAPGQGASWIPVQQFNYSAESVDTELVSVLDRIKAKLRTDIPDLAMMDVDNLFDTVDALCLTGAWDRLNSALGCLNPAQQSIEHMLCVLSTTLSAAGHVPAREDYYLRVQAHLERIDPGRVDRLLEGLRIPAK